jgi:7-keto-8-aminopelargonate synthetase-like enzyme
MEWSIGVTTEILINVAPRENRAALIENGVLTELYVERQSRRGIVSNLYKGRVQRVLPGMQAAGFRLLPGDHPIIPVMIGDAALAARFADKLLGEGVYVIGFSFPVVPKGEARIRTQMSAGLTDAQLDRALAAFIKVGRELELIK